MGLAAGLGRGECAVLVVAANRELVRFPRATWRLKLHAGVSLTAIMKPQAAAGRRHLEHRGHESAREPLGGPRETDPMAQRN